MCVNIFIQNLRSMYILVVASNKKYDCLIIQTAQTTCTNTTTQTRHMHEKLYTRGLHKAKLIKLIDFYSQSNKIKSYFYFIDGNIRK